MCVVFYGISCDLGNLITIWGRHCDPKVIRELKGKQEINTQSFDIYISIENCYYFRINIYSKVKKMYLYYF